MKEFPQHTALLDARMKSVDAYYRESIELFERATAVSDQTSVTQRIDDLNEASRRFEQLTAYSSSTPHFLDWVAECQMELGKLLLLAGEPQEAERHVNRAEMLRASPLLRDWTGEMPVWKAYERGKERNICAWSMEKGKAALLLNLEGAQLFSQLADFSPGTKVYAGWLAGCEAGAAKCLSEQGEVTGATWKFQKSNRLRQRLSQSGWRRLVTTCQLANTEYESLRNRETCSANQRQMREGYAKCCKKYREVLSQGYGLQYVDRYLSATERLLELSHTASDLVEAEVEIDHAVDIANTANVAFATEFRAARLLDKKAIRTKCSVVRASQILQLALCFAMLLILGMVDPRLYFLFVVPAAIFARVVGVVGCGLAHDNRRGWLNHLPVVAGCLLGVFHNWGPVFFFVGLMACLSLTYFLNGRVRCPQSDLVFAMAARISRRTDFIADRWARWIAQNAPAWLIGLLLAPDSTRESPRLRQPVYWIAGCCAATFVAREMVLVLAVAIVEYIRTPRTHSCRPDQRDRQNTCTSWAVLLRRPLHLARGDDVPLCA